ncbi:MAG: ABZJ_00895 family protein [Paracoccus sp. (in: a-proteobacteria)]|nr:ABZJ_00895 family protein [Paracoccus sp. (in: a-proteobacteria)]
MSLSQLWRDYTLMFLALSALAFVVLFAVGFFFPDFNMDYANAVGFIIPAIAGMQLGEVYFTKTGTRLGGGLAWKVSALGALTASAFGVAFVMLMVYLVPDMFGGNIPSGREIILTNLAILVGVMLLLTPAIRGFIALGTRSAAKNAERLAAKGK